MDFFTELSSDTRLLTNVLQEHLTWYAKALIAEAREGKCNVRTRRSFLIAVGANALYASASSAHVPYRPIVETVLSNLGGTVAVKSEDPEMAHWDYREWDDEVKGAFRDANDEYGNPAQDTSFIGYIEVLEALRMQRTHHGVPYARSA